MVSPEQEAAVALRFAQMSEGEWAAYVAREDAKYAREILEDGKATSPEHAAALTNLLVIEHGEADFDPRLVPPSPDELARNWAAEQRRIMEATGRSIPAASDDVAAAWSAQRQATQELPLAERIRRQEALVIALLNPAPVVARNAQVGSEWWFVPEAAGYGVEAWKPDIVKVVALHTDPMPPSDPKNPPPPPRQYVIRLPGGTQLFANDASLFPINALRTGPREP